MKLCKAKLLCLTFTVKGYVTMWFKCFELIKVNNFSVSITTENLFIAVLNRT